MKPLDGIKVLDLTRLLPGGFCTLILADLGAEIIKVEQPIMGDYIRIFEPFVDGVSIYHYTVNRGKKSIVLDLKKDEDRIKFYELVKTVDVVVESYRPSVTKKLRIDYETLRRINKRLVYCSIRGFLRDDVKRPIHDLNAQGLSGVIDLMKKLIGKPEKVPIPIADLASGALCAIGILSGIIKARAMGEGSNIVIGMVEASIFWNILAISTILGGGAVEDPLGIKSIPYYNIYETKDNKYLTVAPMEEKFWKSFVEKLGLRIENRDSKEALKCIKDKFLTITLDELIQLFGDNRECIEPVYDIKQVLQDDAFREIFQKIEKTDITALATPIKIDGKINMAKKAPPKLGEDNEELLEK